MTAKPELIAQLGLFINILQDTDQKLDKSGLINEGFDTDSVVEDEEIKNKGHSDSSMDSFSFIKEKQMHGHIATDGEEANKSDT